MLHFRRDIEVPGKGQPVQALAVESQANKLRYVIHYLPWMRHHRVQAFKASAQTAWKVFYVPESAVDFWE